MLSKFVEAIEQRRVKEEELVQRMKEEIDRRKAFNESIVIEYNEIGLEGTHAHDANASI
jgi:hypothetical protein